MQKLSRLKRELAELNKNSDEGISCYARNDKLGILQANIIGPRGSPYEGGLFEIEIKIPERYPFEPPGVKFVTSVYHPNIDTSGRICMDLLKMPPKGGWKPTLNLKNLLNAIQFLLQNPNPDDPLMVEIAEEYRINRTVFEAKARQFTDNSKTKNNR